jgi:hypothetical protein
MSGLIKGKITKMRRPLMKIKLIGGREFWTAHRPELDIYDFVWVIWDHTRGKSTQILTWEEKEKLNSRITEVSPLPAVEDEGPETKAEIEAEDDNNESSEMEGELPEYEDDESFSIPTNEEYEVRSFSDPCV